VIWSRQTSSVQSGGARTGDGNGLHCVGEEKAREALPWRQADKGNG
jgi:hypothetical protein